MDKIKRIERESLRMDLPDFAAAVTATSKAFFNLPGS